MKATKSKSKIAKLSNKNLNLLPTGIQDACNYLYLDNNCFKTFPLETLTLKNLRTLELHKNKLTHLPNEIGRLLKLEKLTLGHNFLTKLPATLGDLKHLEVLLLQKNCIKELPEEIKGLLHLKSLCLEGNELITLPEGLGCLENMVRLDLQNNQLTNIPSFIGNLPKLQELYLNNNKIKELPSAICKLTNLRRLDLQNNKINYLPTGFENLTNLETLNLQNNQLPVDAKILDGIEPLSIIHHCLEKQAPKHARIFLPNKLGEEISSGKAEVDIKEKRPELRTNAEQSLKRFARAYRRVGEAIDRNAQKNGLIRFRIYLGSLTVIAIAIYLLTRHFGFDTMEEILVYASLSCFIGSGVYYAWKRRHVDHKSVMMDQYMRQLEKTCVCFAFDWSLYQEVCNITDSEPEA